MGVTAKASPQGLEKVKQTIIKKGWRKTSPAFSDAACVSTATLKRFWRGIPIGIDSFNAICRSVNVDFSQVVALEPPEKSARSLSTNSSNDYSASKSASRKNSTNKAPNPNNSLLSNITTDNQTTDTQTTEIDPNSRQGLRQSLRHQLLESVRVLAITGLTGTGKTTLARQLASDLEAKGYRSIHLTCDLVASLTLASVVHALSKITSPDSFAFSPAGLLNHLTSQKYLFLIDSCEHLLANDANSGGGQFQSAIWHSFFQSILNAPACSSRFILTSQDIPNAINRSCLQQPARGHICALAGLTALEQAALFQAAGLTADSSDCLTKIGRAYAGHPLALQIIANDIATNYQGNASTYWGTSTPASLHSHSPALQSAIQPRLVQTITRLKIQSPDAFELLCASSHYTAPLTSQSWIQIAQSIALAPGHYRNLPNLLCDRALIIPTVIQNRPHFYPHPLVRSLMLTQIHGTPQTVPPRTKQSAHKKDSASRENRRLTT